MKSSSVHTSGAGAVPGRRRLWIANRESIVPRVGSLASAASQAVGPLLSDWVTLPSYEVLSSIRQIVYADKAVLDIGGLQPGARAVGGRRATFRLLGQF